MFKVEALSGVGGVGKSTLILLLAGHWSRDGAKVCVVDADQSKQLSDAMRKNPGDFEVRDSLPAESEGFDICLIDTRPGTDRPNHDPDVVLYPMLPHEKSIKALERAKKMLKTDRILFVTNKCDYRKTMHRENAKVIKAIYGGKEVRDNSFYERVMANGGNWLDYKKDNNYYKAKNAVALIAQELEKYV